MAGSIRDRAIALAGVCQAAYLVQQVARRGSAEPDSTEASIGSIFKIDARDVVDIFDGVYGVARGIKVLRSQIGTATQAWDKELIRYIAGILQLERKFIRRRDMVEKLRAGILQASPQAETFSVIHPNVIARLADLYVQTISTLTPRIVVTGEQAHLSNPDNANLIRALLLAGIRSAVLWRQLGGKGLQLLFERGALLREANQLLSAPSGN